MKKAALVLSLIVLSSLVYAEEVAEQAKSLKGLKSVAIEVDITNLPIAERYGLRVYEIAKKMEHVLTTNSIHVAIAKEQDADPNIPVLRVYITPMIDEKNNACSVSVDMTLRQTIRLNSDTSVVVKDVGTWRQNSVALINSKLLLPAVTERVDTYLKIFIEDWRFGNGMEKPSDEKKGKVSV